MRKDQKLEQSGRHPSGAGCSETRRTSNQQETPTLSTSSDRIILLSLRRESRILSVATDGSDMKVLIGGLESKPDGVTIDPINRHLFYTFMGVTSVNGDFWDTDSHIERANLDGSDRRV